MTAQLADRIAVLRDEVLDTAIHGDEAPPGGEVFDAILRRLVAADETDPGLDLTLHEALARRLAWGDRELDVLADADVVCQRLLGAARRAFRGDPSVDLRLVEAVADVGSAAARAVALAALGRAGRERAARLREEAAATRLQDALTRVRDEIARLADGR